MEKQVTVQDLDALVEVLFQLKKKIEESEEATTKLNKEKATLEMKIAGYLRDLGRDNFRAPDGTVSLREVWRVSLPKTDEAKAALFGWMREKGIYDQYATVNANSLNSLFLAEWDAAKKQGEGIGFTLPGLAQPTLFETLSTLKAKKEQP